MGRGGWVGRFLPLSEGPPLRDHELDFPTVLDLGGQVDEPEEEEEERADRYLGNQGPVFEGE